ncbi:MAG: MerR family transcriptional regulator [Proteobacteria bacterium]|nr:MerR family transcriptional regulator [Pseudomonadota bacterium]MCP4921302.1 MerR family transcriptional regulator [Pseudomonadota bacterium]
MRIGQLVKRSGKTARTLHFYEELGLLRPSSRTNGGFRLYSDDALLRIQWIERLQEIGFSLSEIQDFLARLNEQASGPEAMTRLADFYREKLQDTSARLARLKALETDLTNSLEYLEGCRPCDPLTPRTACASCTEHHDDTQPTMVAAVHRN